MICVLSDLGGADLPEAHDLSQFAMPVPEHEGQGGQRPNNAEKRGEKEKAQKDKIEDSARHLTTLPLDRRNSGAETF